MCVSSLLTIICQTAPVDHLRQTTNNNINFCELKKRIQLTHLKTNQGYFIHVG